MYRKANYHKSSIKSIALIEGEPIEWKIERIMSNNEPIQDGAPEIFTERKEGVISAYNIRTDRWEVACEGMDAVSKSVEAKRDNRATAPKKEDHKEAKVVKLEPKKDSGAESTNGTSDS
jgi:hypothetical protein